jgi:hypothetical protein
LFKTIVEECGHFIFSHSVATEISTTPSALNFFINIITICTQCRATLTNKMPRQADIDHQYEATCTALSRLAESIGIPEAADPIPHVPPTHFNPPASVQEAFVAAFGRPKHQLQSMKKTAMSPSLQMQKPLMKLHMMMKGLMRRQGQF